MSKAIQYSFVFVTLSVLVSITFGDTFDETVTQIKNQNVALEGIQTSIAEKREQVNTLITEFRENHPLGAPKDQFESDADYAARLQQLESVVSQHLAELEELHLSPLLSGKSQIQIRLARLQRTVFVTDDITATLGTYDANNEFFPITFQTGDQSIEVRLYIQKDDARILFGNWEDVSVSGWIAIDPGYRRGLAQARLVYTPIWEKARTWTFHEVYRLADNHTAIAFSADGKYIATGGDRVHTIWETSSGRELRQKEHNSQVLAVTFSPDGQYLATGDRYRLKLWEVSNGKQIWERNKTYSRYGSTFSTSFYAVDFSPDGQYLATANGRGTFVVTVNGGRNFWGRTRYYSRYGSTSYAASHAVDFSPDGQYLAAGDTFEDAIIWNPSNDTLIQRIEHSDDVWEVAFSPDGKYLATGDNAGNVSICEVSSGTKLQELPHNGGWIGAVAFSPNGTYLAVGHENRKITFYRMGQETININSEISNEKTLQASGPVYDLAWHPNGNLISDGRKVYRPLLEPIVTDLMAKPINTRRDVNRDGVVDVEDLVLVAANFGKSFATDANPNPDVNRDGVVNLTDIIEIVLSLQGTAGAPTIYTQLTTENLQYWIEKAKAYNNSDVTFQKGIDVLERLSETLTETAKIPEKTSLLSNYPNPFNPETWIPYQLAEAADVTVRIYSANGTLVRTLELGHRPAGIYQNRTDAAYWDGRNAQGEQVASGVYFYTLSTESTRDSVTAGDFTATQKMLLMK